jgi:hypothetical protein
VWVPLERASVNHWTLPPTFYLTTEAQPVSETLFFKEKRWMMDKVLTQDSWENLLLLNVSVFRVY